MDFSFDGCAPAMLPAVERIARIELHAAEDDGGPATQIALACDGDDARITVDDPLTGKRVERTVSLATVPDLGRARLLALATAELVRSSWIELELTPAPALPVAHVEQVSAAQKAEARDVAMSVGRRVVSWRGYAAVEGLYIPSIGRPIVGLTLGVQRDLLSWLYVEGGVSAWDGVTERATGAVTVRPIALDPAVGFRLPVVDVAIGARVGWASLAGSPSGPGFRGDTTSGLLVGPLVAASVALVGPLRVWLRAGWILHGDRGVVAGDADVVAGGFWTSLGLGLRLPP